MQKLFDRMSSELSLIAFRDQLRVPRPPRGHDFCSNDYLSLTRHEVIQKAAMHTLTQEGYGSSSSRYIRGEREIYHALENKLARFKGCDRSVLFSSGYAANVGALAAIIKKSDVVFSDKLNHASIIDGLRLSGATIRIFPHNDVDALRVMLAESSSQESQRFIVTESLFSMDGDIAPLNRYAELARSFNAALIVDEAHATGLYGKNGAGLVDYFGVTEQVLLSLNPLGKAFGCYGAFAAGSEIVITYLVQRARTLMFSTALPPLCIAAIDAAVTLVENGNNARAKLFNNARLLRDLLLAHGIPLSASDQSPIIPVIIGDNQQARMLAENMLQAGFDVRAIRPPTVSENSARLRITANTSQSESLIRAFVNQLVSQL